MFKFILINIYIFNKFIVEKFEKIEIYLVDILNTKIFLNIIFLILYKIIIDY